MAQHDVAATADLECVKERLRAEYGLGTCTIGPFPGTWEGNVYHVSRPDGPDWTLRLLDQVSAAGDARVLTFLERVGYPAPRLIRTTAGATFGAGAMLVTTFIPGVQADFSPETLYRLGALLGELHQLDADVSPSLPPAEMLPAADMATARAWLQPLAPPAAPGLARTYEELIAAIETIDPGDHLPTALIHNDAHPGNAVLTPEGSAVYIDWHGAGLGPPMVDLGMLLISSEIAPDWARPIPPGSGRLEAIVAGYASRRTPTPDELAWLPHALRFRGLLYGAAHLADAVQDGHADVTETWWWERYLVADAVAEQVRARFGAG